MRRSWRREETEAKGTERRGECGMKERERKSLKDKYRKGGTERRGEGKRGENDRQK